MGDMMYAGPPPPVDPRVLRPKRGWYVFAGLVAGLSLLAAPVLLIVGVGAIGSVGDTLPTMNAEFERGAPATVALTTGQTWAVYVADPDYDADATADPSPDASQAAGDAYCAVEPVGGGTADLERVWSTVHVSEAGRQWRQVYRFTVSQDGSYRVTCQPTGPLAPGLGFAVGEDANIAGFIGRMFGGIGSIFAAVLVPCTGLLLGGLIALVVGLRRNLHRKRLQGR